MIALLLPSYRRFKELFRTLWKTPISADCKFVVVANYHTWQLLTLRIVFAKKAIFVDERKYGRLGGCKAYNLAFKIACQNGAEYVALWADDILPERKDWFQQVQELFIQQGCSFGIFSSDECHPGRFGWNFINSIPNAHFFIAKTAALNGVFFNERFNQYVVDYEICVRLLRKGVCLIFLPVKIIHKPSPKHRKLYAINYSRDIDIFNEIYPSLRGTMDKIVLEGDYKACKFIRDEGAVLQTDEKLKYLSYEQFMK